MSTTKTADDFIKFLEQTYEIKMVYWQKEFAKAVWDNGGKPVNIPKGYGYSQTLAYMELLRLIFLEVTNNET